MVNSLEKRTWLSMAEAEQRRVTKAVAEGKMKAPEKRSLGRHKDSDFHRAQQTGVAPVKPKPGEKHWSEMHHFTQIKHARDIYGKDDAVEVIQTANDARRFLANHYGEPHLVPHVCTDES